LEILTDGPLALSAARFAVNLISPLGLFLQSPLRVSPLAPVMCPMLPAPKKISWPFVLSETQPPIVPPPLQLYWTEYQALTLGAVPPGCAGPVQ
jgi:hypothetical protein